MTLVIDSFEAMHFISLKKSDVQLLTNPGNLQVIEKITSFPQILSLIEATL